MLKRKVELNYRKAIHRFVRCKICAHKQWSPIFHIGEKEPNHYAWRCEQIGLDNSNRYSIADDHVCDQFRGK